MSYEHGHVAFWANEERVGKMRTRIIVLSKISTAIFFFAAFCLIATVASPSRPLEVLADRTPPRMMQQSPSTDFLMLNPPSVLKAIESHIFSPSVQRDMHKLFSSRVQFNGEEYTYPSLQYTFDGFWNGWKTNMRTKLLFAGDNQERNMTIISYSERGKRLPDRAIIISGFEYGLANMAAFLAQAMVDGIYADECSKLTSMAENKCQALTEEERWAVPIDKWLTVQDYSFRKWDYKEQLVAYVDGGMNRLEYHSGSKVDYSFIHSVSGVYRVDCHDVDDEGKSGSQCRSSSSGVVKDISQRRTAFSMALSALHIPRLREVELMETTLGYLKERKDGFVDNLLLFKSGDNLYPSQRYQFDDMASAIELFSKPPSNVTLPYLDATKTYFESPDHGAFYIGDPYMRHGHKYGLGNIALFFANSLHLSIEKDDACDEPNEHEVNGKIPISNSCGQRGLSYQDMVCLDENQAMACPVDEDMELTAVTFGRQVGSPPPLMCAPRSQVKHTGYWDTELIREEKKAAYASENGRVDVSGCCWWGRGVLQTKGVCAFGRLNHYLGAKAKSLGRASLFPNIDFCANPEAICSSQYSQELIWMSGLFLWIDRVQSYDQGGFNYMEELLLFADSGFNDEEFIIKTNHIVKLGCHNPPCQNAGCINSSTCSGDTSDDEDTGNFVTKAFRTFIEVDLWSFPASPGGSNMPSPSPTRCKTNCTDAPTYPPLDPTITPSSSPMIVPTSQPTESPTSKTNQRKAYFNYVIMIFENKRQQIVQEVFATPNDPVYTFDGFLKALEDMYTAEPEGLSFFLGQDAKSNLGHGIVNIALFLAHASTRGLRTNSCVEETRFDINDNCPMHVAEDECPVLVESTTRRGILLNQSPCEIGRFNKIFGKPAYNNNRESARYRFDFCLRPQVICYDSTVAPSGAILNTEDIKYLLGLVEWIDRVQSYSWGYWSYIERLKTFVDDGMVDFTFVDEFSEMVVKSPVDADLRRSTFKALLHILFSELNLNSPSSVAVPPDDFETASPSSGPVYSPYAHDFSPTNTQPAGTLQPHESVQKPNNPGGIESSLSANTRVELTNAAVASVYSTTAFYNTMFAFLIILHSSM